MSTLAAALDAINVALDRGYANVFFESTNIDAKHLKGIADTMTDETMPDNEKIFWLGFIQGVLVANECLTLHECKNINQRHSV